MDIRFRPYQRADQADCLRMFDSNTPEFFASTERATFADFLQATVFQRPYLVLAVGGRIIACGGLQIDLATSRAFLSWGMVDRAWHGRGIGRVLTQARLDLARRTAGIAAVTLNTSQHTRDFYARFGFVAVKTTPNGYGPGLDRWDMVLKLG